MVKVPDPTVSISGDIATFTGPGGFQKQVPLALWEKVVGDYNKGLQERSDQYARAQRILSDPSDPWWTAEMASSAYSGPVTEAQRRAIMQSVLNSNAQYANFTPIDPYNVPQGESRLMTGLATNLASQQYANFADDYFSARDAEVKRLQAADKGPWYRSFTKTAVPVGMALIGAGLGGAALAPGAMSSLLGGTALSGSGAALSPGAIQMASGGGLLPSITSGAVGGGIGSALTSSFAPKAALSGAIKGGLGGYMSGGDLSSALKGAGLGGLTGGYGDALAGAAGLSGAGAKAFTGALTGASGGAATGDLRSALLGGALGGGSSYVMGSLTKPGAVMAGGGSSSMGGSMLSDALKAGGTLYSGYNTKKANEEIQRQLMEAQGRAFDQIAPYQQTGLDAQNQLSQALQGGFQPGDLTQDPGYQFQLAEGNRAAERQLAAMGMSQSGAAIKAAQDRAQGLADQTYNDAYQRWLAKNNQLAGVAQTGYNAAQNAAGLQQGMGEIGAYGTAANNQNFNQTLASLLENQLLSRALQWIF